MTKHPGPWREPCEGGTATTVVDATGSEVIGIDHGWDSCDDSVGFADDDAKRLILAAPELLAALKECAQFVPNTGGSGVFGRARAAYLAAEALVARIEGR